MITGFDGSKKLKMANASIIDVILELEVKGGSNNLLTSDDMHNCCRQNIRFKEFKA